MGRYALIKLLLIIPSLVLLSLLVFTMSKLAPGDPVASVVELRGQVSEEFNTGELSPEYLAVAKELRLNLPAFYFSIHPAYYPDTIYRLVHPARKAVRMAWLQQTHNWPGIEAFLEQLQTVRFKALSVPDSILGPDQSKQLLQLLKKIETSASFELLEKRMEQTDKLVANHSGTGSEKIRSGWAKMLQLFQSLEQSQGKPWDFLPRLRFHGLENQYHLWLAGLLRFDLGSSVIDAQPATSKISYALGWTLFYVLIAYVLSLMIAIPLGLFNAWNHGKPVEKLVSSLSFIFYAFPLFWIATLAAVFLTNDLYAPWLHLFPGIGVGNISAEMSFFNRIGTAFPYLVLPALVIVLHSAASGIRIVRNSAFSELKSDYFITAKAKGLNKFQLALRHILPNAMLPVITLLVSSFPAALTGSVVLEVIFNIPGMGRLLYDSILFMDWNIVFGILIFMGLITLVFYLIGDLLYAYLNPRIKYDIK